MQKQYIQNQILSIAQIEEIFGAVPNDGRLENALIRAIMEVLFSTGIKVGELVRLKKKDVDSLGEVVHVRRAFDQERIVPISPRALKALQEYLDARSKVGESSLLLFSTEKGRRITVSFIGNQIRRCLDLAEIRLSSEFLFLRHNFAVYARQEGMQWESLREILNHSLVGSTRRAYLGITIPA